MLASARFHRRMLFATATAFLCAICALLALPASAQASSSYTILTPTKAENTAYNRCLNVAMNYADHPQSVTVDISDLKLTNAQAIDVERRIHSNGELWWVNTWVINPSPKSMTIVFRYDDAEIDSMRKKFESAVKAALKRIGPGMSNATKVHMLHDYIIDKVDYQATYKNAYEGLVNKRGDCFGYTLTFDVLARRAGFKTDVAINTGEGSADHSWNLVKFGGKWYHVDTTWDRSWTYKYFKGKHCHKWLLLSDKVMSWDEHAGWTAHNRATSNTYQYADVNGVFSKECNAYKKIVRSFSKGGLKYQVTGVGKVIVSKVAKNKKTVVVPASITYKKVKYRICGFVAGVFAKAKTQKVVVKSKTLAKKLVKGSLAGSKVKSVEVPKTKLKAYRQYFAAGNAGKSVKVR